MVAAEVTVLFFGAAREITGRESGLFTAENSGELGKLLLERYPGLAKISFRMAKNRVFIKEDTGLKRNDIIAILPPFQGG